MTTYEFPPTPTQEALWFIDRVGSQPSAYNIPLGFRLQGPLDANALRAALEFLITRHEIFRTVFVERDGGVVQRVLPAMPLDLQVVTATTPPPSPAEMRALASDEAARRFQLDSGPLIRARLWSWGADEHLFTLVLHHIVIDHISLAILTDELDVCYRAFREDRSPPLPEPDIHFPDYAVWFREEILPTTKPSGVDRWAALLDGFSGTLDLPSDGSRVDAGEGGSETRFRWSDEASEKIRAFARSEGLSLFNVLLGALQVLLHRASGQRDILIGTPFANRGDDAGLDTLVGCLINTLPIPAMVDPDADFRTLLRSSRAAVLEAHELQSVPFEAIVARVKPHRDPAYNPLYQVGFVFQEPPVGLSLDGVTATDLEVHTGAAMYDLHFWLWEADGAIAGLTWYDDGLFAEADTDGWIRRWEALAVALVTDPERPIGDHELVSEEDRRSIRRWNDNARDWSGANTVWHMVRDAAALHPDAPAVIVGDNRLAYSELMARADALSTYLVDRPAGALVGLALERDERLLPALLGVLGAGVAYVPIDPDFPPDRIRHMIQASGIERIVTTSELAPALPDEGVDLLLLDEIDLSEPESPPAGPDPDALAYVIFTSGSTGVPKGVSVPHSCVRNFLCSMAERPGLDATDRLLAVTTLSFDIAVLELFLPLTRGASVVLANADDTRDGRSLLRLMEDHDVTVMQATPTSWRLLLEAGWSGGPLRAFCGGEALPPDLGDALANSAGEVWNLYGPTETTIWSTVGSVRAGERITIGTPIANTTCHVLDERMRTCPIGTPGELYIGGAGVARGYIGQPEQTAARFVTHPSADGRLYRTGDRARWRFDGSLEHLGRLDHQVKVHGFRIELAEIETTLERHPDIDRAVATVSRGDHGDDRLIAYLRFAPGRALLANEVRRHLRQSLPDYMVPGLVVEIDEVPLTPNGKIDRSALPDPTSSRMKREHRPPETVAQKTVAAVWADLLGVERISLHDNFFELGGHSLLAMRAVARLESQLAAELDPRTLFFQTLEQVAHLLEPSKGSA